MPRTIRPVALVLAVYLPLAACVPAFQPRHVSIPVECEELLGRAAAQGPEAVAADEALYRRVTYCQQQRALRADEEQAAHARMQAQLTQIGFWLGIVSTVISLVLLSITDYDESW